MVNREKWRALKSMNAVEGQKWLTDLVEGEADKAREYGSKAAFACIMMALHQRFPDWTGAFLFSIAKDAVDLSNEVLTPEEIMNDLYDETGFNIRVKTEDQPFEYIEKGA